MVDKDEDLSKLDCQVCNLEYVIISFGHFCYLSLVKVATERYYFVFFDYLGSFEQ